MKTHSDLSQLTAAPSYRGALEYVNDRGLGGWCICAAAPESTVQLNIHCEGIALPTIRTTLVRQDLADSLHLPVSAGFRFEWRECQLSQRQQLLAALQAAPPDKPILLCVTIDSDLHLDDRYALTQGWPCCDELCAALQALENNIDHTAIALREALLDEASTSLPATAFQRAKFIAFYLPQFHPIAENDEWWGPGFTEWTNVSAAQPLFKGHHQPRLPAELGYYDLRTPGVIERQIALAQQHGLAGFCFYHYWMGGTPLLEKPLERFVALPHDFGFCLCWANEPWSRRWDGSAQEELLAQPHDFSRDLGFITAILPYLKDPRYLRVGKLPLLLIYRVSLLPEPQRLFDRWREIAVEQGLPGLHICMAETFGSTEPFDFGCDSSVEFPPHGLLGLQPAPVGPLPTHFKGHVFDYGEVVTHKVIAPQAPYPHFKTVMLAWDNSPRRGLQASAYVNFSPELFERWLAHAVTSSQSQWPDENRYVFINAWNEWAEGSYLEPDRQWGQRNLAAVRNVAQGQLSLATSLDLLHQALAQNPQALAQLQALESHIGSQENALQHALEIARASKIRLPAPCFSQTPPAYPKPPALTGHGTIRRIGGRINPNYFVLPAGDWLYIEGSFQPKPENTPCFLALSPQDSQMPSYFAPLDLLAEPEQAWQAFRLSARSTSIAAGMYELSIATESAEIKLTALLEIVA